MERKHHDLVVWQQAIALVKKVYALTRDFPPQEMYGLTSQMRRAAISGPANIAEGVGRAGHKDRLHFLNIARTSLNELDTFIVLAQELDYAKDVGESQELVDRVFALLSRLTEAERRKSNT